MLIGFIAVSFLVGLFITIIWSTNGMANVLIKMIFAIYTLVAAAMLLGVLVPIVAATPGMRLF